MPVERKKRGPYKKYLHDAHAVMPKTSAWRRSKLEKAQTEVQLQAQPAASTQHDQDQEDSNSKQDSICGWSCASSVSPQSPSSSACSPTQPSLRKCELQDEAMLSPQSVAVTPLDEDSDSSKSEDSSWDDDIPYHYVDEEMLDVVFHSDSDTEDSKELIEMEDKHPEGKNFKLLQPIYGGAPLGHDESLVLLMSFILRWGMEEHSIEHLLQLVDCHLPLPVLHNKESHIKEFLITDGMRIFFVCPNPRCSQLLRPIDSLSFKLSEELDCQRCGIVPIKADLKEYGNYFVQLSVTQQIKRIVQSSELQPLLRRECQENDVVSGKTYKRLRKSGIIGENDLTLQWNIDCVSPCEDANIQVWPIQACVNELPFNVRNENMILCGMYFGEKKPKMNVILRPFVSELKSLHTHGFLCSVPGEDKEINIRVHTLLATVDSAMRPLLQETKLHTGSYGCSFCLKPGVKVAGSRRYPGGSATLRTIDQHLAAIHQLRLHSNKIEHVQGVKGQSVLLGIPVFNITSSFVPDSLHAILGGVTKTFLMHWTDDNYSNAPYHLSSKKLSLVSEKLKGIQTPSEIKKKPLDMNFHSWKVSEFRNFLLYYSVVCLKGILPTRYLKHWFLLSYGMSVFLRERFTKEESISAKLALYKFVEQIAIVYPNCMHLYTYNVHLLLHTPRAAKLYGALWATSTYPYGHFNRLAARLLLGSRCRPQQICQSFVRLRYVAQFGSKLFLNPHSSSKGKELFKSLLHKYYFNGFTQALSKDLHPCGVSQTYQLTGMEIHCIQQKLAIKSLEATAISFKGLMYKGTEYHAGAGSGSVLKIGEGLVVSVSCILFVGIPGTEQKICVVVGEPFDVTGEDLCRDRELNLLSSQFISVCKKRSGQIVCFVPEELAEAKKCISIPYGISTCVVALVNSLTGQ